MVLTVVSTVYKINKSLCCAPETSIILYVHYIYNKGDNFSTLPQRFAWLFLKGRVKRCVSYATEVLNLIVLLFLSCGTSCCLHSYIWPTSCHSGARRTDTRYCSGCYFVSVNLTQSFVFCPNIYIYKLLQAYCTRQFVIRHFTVSDIIIPLFFYMNPQKHYNNSFKFNYINIKIHLFCCKSSCVDIFSSSIVVSEQFIRYWPQTERIGSIPTEPLHSENLILCS